MTSQTSDPQNGEITQLLARWNARDMSEQARLLALVYPELKRLANFRMRRERQDHTLQPTALVNEFVVQICMANNLNWRDRVHFLAVASRAMRRILVDYARAHNADKRGGQRYKIEIEGLDIAEANPFSDVLELHDLLEQLAADDGRMAEIVELRFFGGLSNTEVAEVLGVAERTVRRDWQFARAWLFQRMRAGGADASTNELTGSPSHGR